MSIAVEFAGKPALLVGPRGRLGDAIARGMEANGAVVRRYPDGGGAAPDILVILATDPAFDAAAAEPMLRECCGEMGEGGRVVMVVPALGLIAARDEAAESVRAAGLVALTRVLAMELAARRIAVNAAALGPLAGEAGVSARMVSHVPLRRGARDEEIVAAVLFLADPENTYMTGHVLAVDGGWSAGFARDF